MHISLKSMCQNFAFFKNGENLFYSLNTIKDLCIGTADFVMNTHMTDLPRGVQRERTQPVGLGQKQSNQPVLG